MSHKYDVGTLRKRALGHLSRFHPTTLREWEKLDGQSAPWLDELMEDNGSILQIAILARKLSIDWILPIAFYRICERTHASPLLNGICGIRLNRSDRVRCVTVCRHLEMSAVTKILDFLWTPLEIDSCLSPEFCTLSRLKVRRQVEDWRIRDLEDAPRFPLDIWEEIDWDELDACGVCMSAMKSTHGEAKQAFWDGLPALFGLPSWEELEKIKAEALT